MKQFLLMPGPGLLPAFLVVFSLVWPAPFATAQEATEADTEEAAAGAADAEPAAAEAGDDEAPQSEVFIPTEEISEDFAVSFPVDI